MIYRGTMTARGFHADAALAWTAAKVALMGKRVQVTLEPEHRDKTQSQLGYYFDVLVPLWMDYTGYSKEEMHHELKLLCIDPKVVTCRLTGKETVERETVSEMSVPAMSDFIDRVIREGNSHGIEFPPPR